MAKDKATGEVVAIKKIRSLNEVQGVSLQPIEGQLETVELLKVTLMLCYWLCL